MGDATWIPECSSCHSTSREIIRAGDDGRRYCAFCVFAAMDRSEELRARLESARAGLEYAAEQLHDRFWTCDCRMSGSGGCFEQCPLHAALGAAGERSEGG